MRLSCPRFTTWLLATIAGLGGILMHFGVLHLGRLNPYSFWFVAGAFALLWLSTMMRRL